MLATDGPVEVSLDCTTCRRRRRTVVFSEVGGKGRCLPTGHEFDGQLEALHAVGNVVRAEFRYRFEPFEDAKYGDGRYDSFEAGAPTWVRLRFQLRCSVCRHEAWDSTQSNIARPWFAACRCGAPLYDELDAPILGWRAL